MARYFASYFEIVILRDIVERHHVTNIALLKYLAMTIIKNAATLFSINKFYNDAKSQGYKMSKDTLHHYLNYLQDAFLIFTVPIYSESLGAMQNKPKKMYAIDSGLINAMSINIHDIYGKLLENLIYLDLRRQNKKIYFYQTLDGYEVDFFTIDPEGKRELIQVAWDLTDIKTMEREKRALNQAEKELNVPGKIITAKDYLRQILDGT